MCTLIFAVMRNFVWHRRKFQNLDCCCFCQCARAKKQKREGERKKVLITFKWDRFLNIIYDVKYIPWYIVAPNTIACYIKHLLNMITRSTSLIHHGTRYLSELAAAFLPYGNFQCWLALEMHLRARDLIFCTSKHYRMRSLVICASHPCFFYVCS